MSSGLTRWACLSLLSLGLLSLIVTMNWAGPTAPPSPATPLSAHTIPPEMQRLRSREYWAQRKKAFTALTNFAWGQEAWTGDDAPYARARAQIKRAEAAGESPAQLLSQYEPLAKREPDNALAQFRWAYAVCLFVQSSACPPQEVTDRLYNASLALAEAPSPHTYNYDRLKYLAWVRRAGGGASHFLKDMAYRLLQKDPQDFPVQAGLIALLTQNENREAQKEGYELIQRIIKTAPAKPDGYDFLGGWYYTQYMFYHDPQNYQQALTYYRKALAMYPATDTRRAQLPAIMQFLEMRYHQISGG